MCFDTTTSLTTFAIGTTANVWNVSYYDAPIVRVVSLLWQWVLTMQLADAVAWQTQPKNGEVCSTTNNYASKLAFLFNVTQPIILIVLLMSLDLESMGVSKAAKNTALGILMVYVMWLLYVSNKIPEVQCLVPGGTSIDDPSMRSGTSEAEKCDHLTYDWWSRFPGSVSMYWLTLAVGVLLLIKPTSFALAQMAYITATFLISLKWYRCGTGSVWCWFAAFAPIYTAITWEVINRSKN